LQKRYRLLSVVSFQDSKATFPQFVGGRHADEHVILNDKNGTAVRRGRLV
jgi:hypothetical protein